MPPKKTIVGEKSRPLIKKSVIEELGPSSLYDIITSKEFINFNKEFAKNLIALYIYKTVYDAAAPRPVIAPEPEPEPVRRGIVVPARRGIVVEGRRPDIIPPEQPAANLNETNEEQENRIRDIIKRTIETHSTEEGMGFTDGNALQHVGKEAFKALLLAGLAGAVGTYAIKSAENERNLNYDAENTTPYTVPPQNSPYNLEERAKNWTTEVRHERQMHDILSEFDDISDITSDSSGISHFSSGSYGLGLKKNNKEKPLIISDYELFNQVAQRINNKIREGIKYIYEKSPDKKTIMTFIAVIFALGTALIFTNSNSLTEEAINHIMNFSQILSDCANGRVTLNGVKAYVEHYVNMVMPRGGKLKPQKSKKSMNPPEVIPDTFYEKRIKPITKKAYDIITSDESITVAKTLAQIAFLTIVMYGIKEAGTSMYGALTPSPENLRTARQDLIELAESEIARPTFYTGRRGEIVEYDKSQYPREWPTNVGQYNRFSENYTPPNISKINRILGEADSTIFRDPKNTELINTLKKEDPIHIKNLMLKHDTIRRNPSHPFVEEFREHLPTLKEKIKWKKGQMLSGKGLNEDIEYSKAKLKKVAKKIYDTMKSKHGQDAIKGITATTILAGLTALLHSTLRPNAPHQLSPEELKEQYMNSIGESVLF